MQLRVMSWVELLRQAASTATPEPSSASTSTADPQRLLLLPRQPAPGSLAARLRQHALRSKRGSASQLPSEADLLELWETLQLFNEDLDDKVVHCLRLE